MSKRLQKIREKWTDARLMGLNGVSDKTAPDVVFKAVAEADPTPNHKYVDWTLTAWERGTLQWEDIRSGRESRVADQLIRFESNKHRIADPAMRSLMKYRSPGELDAIMDKVGVSREVGDYDLSSHQEKKVLMAKARLESHHIETPSGLQFDIPFTLFSSCILGRGTRWCTAASKDNAFEDYASEGPLIIVTLPSGERFQSHAVLSDVMTSIDTDEIIEAMNAPALSPVLPGDETIADRIWRLCRSPVGFEFLIMNENDTFPSLDQFNSMEPYFSEISTVLGGIYHQITKNFFKIQILSSESRDDVNACMPYLGELMTRYLQEGFTEMKQASQQKQMDGQKKSMSPPRQEERQYNKVVDYIRPYGSSDFVVIPTETMPTDISWLDIRTLFPRLGMMAGLSVSTSSPAKTIRFATQKLVVTKDFLDSLTPDSRLKFIEDGMSNTSSISHSSELSFLAEVAGHMSLSARVKWAETLAPRCRSLDEVMGISNSLLGPDPMGVLYGNSEENYNIETNAVWYSIFSSIMQRSRDFSEFMRVVDKDHKYRGMDSFPFVLRNIYDTNKSMKSHITKGYVDFIMDEQNIDRHIGGRIYYIEGFYSSDKKTIYRKNYKDEYDFLTSLPLEQKRWVVQYYLFMDNIQPLDMKAVKQSIPLMQDDTYIGHMALLLLQTAAHEKPHFLSSLYRNDKTLTDVERLYLEYLLPLAPHTTGCFVTPSSQVITASDYMGRGHLPKEAVLSILSGLSSPKATLALRETSQVSKDILDAMEAGIRADITRVEGPEMREVTRRNDRILRQDSHIPFRTNIYYTAIHNIKSYKGDMAPTPQII